MPDMKKIFFALALTTIAMTSFMLMEKSTSLEAASQDLAWQVASSLKNSSVESYASLFPSVNEFHEMMDDNKDSYGPYLADAKKSFASEYVTALMPKVKESFNNLLVEIKSKGIDLNYVRLVRFEALQTDDSAVTIEIVF